MLARAPFSSAEDVHRAAETAAKAFYNWRRTPVGERIQPLFKLKSLLEAHRDELALSITDECGKTLAESRGELQRAIENVETACAMPTQMQGQLIEDVAKGIDEFTIRQPGGRPNRFRPRHQRGGQSAGGHQFTGNRSNGNVHGGPPRGMRSGGGRPPQGQGATAGRRQGPGGRKRSK